MDGLPRKLCPTYYSCKSSQFRVAAGVLALAARLLLQSSQIPSCWTTSAKSFSALWRTASIAFGTSSRSSFAISLIQIMSYSANVNSLTRVGSPDSMLKSTGKLVYMGTIVIWQKLFKKSSPRGLRTIRIGRCISSQMGWINGCQAGVLKKRLR